MSERFVVIMAGGRGERFWPQSREATPKHLLPIVGDKPMLAQTVDRVAGVVPPANIFVITTQAQFAGCRAACPGLPAAHIGGAPMGRHTAAATDHSPSQAGAAPTATRPGAGQRAARCFD